MIFDCVSFIKPASPFQREHTGTNLAPMFRKKFFLQNKQRAVLYVCGLGHGYYYINGKKVSEDLFTVPVSDYNKTLWYQKYDVTELLEEGENVICAILGNGYFNEELKTVWGDHNAPWRDVPKMIAVLTAGDEIVLQTDSSWKCQPHSAIYYNALRSGEYFDARLYDELWCEKEYDDTDWEYAIEDDFAPKGIFRECLCEPIREHEVLKPVNIIKQSENSYCFDFGKNSSGYVRLSLSGTRGQLLTIRYDEEIQKDLMMRGHLKDHFYEGEFQTDRFISSGKPIVWSPRFTYHGFRYVTVDGIKTPDEIQIEAVFVHQAIERKTSFECSDERLNRMFEAGVRACYSNMFNLLTDCPTREKYGWANDAQSSCEQMLTNFKTEKMFHKWLLDIYDAMRDDGMLPGIIPTSGWGYEWGNGPVSDGLLFELPMRLYLHTGDVKPLTDSLPYFDRYLTMLESKRDENGLIYFGLDDWANPGFQIRTPGEFICAVLIWEFYEIAALAARLKGVDSLVYETGAQKQKNIIFHQYLRDDGSCSVEEQTAVAMLIYFGLYREPEPLKQQLLRLIDEKDGHHCCGMVGLRRLLLALNLCGLEETAYAVLMKEGYPGYQEWFRHGATTLWEVWETEPSYQSKNHHMYSDFMSWTVKTVLGIRLNPKAPGSKAFLLEPRFLKELSYAKGTYETECGMIVISWERTEKGIVLNVTVPKGIAIEYNGEVLSAGEHQFTKTVV